MRVIQESCFCDLCKNQVDVENIHEATLPMLIINHNEYGTFLGKTIKLTKKEICTECLCKTVRVEMNDFMFSSEEPRLRDEDSPEIDPTTVTVRI